MGAKGSLGCSGPCRCNCGTEQAAPAPEGLLSGALALDESAGFDTCHLKSTQTGAQGPRPVSSLQLVAGQQQPERFEVQLSKKGAQSFGFAHVPMEDNTNTLLVVDVKDDGPYPIGNWNAKQRDNGMQEHTVQEGDRIVTVGGATSELEVMRAELRKETVVFTVERWPRLVPVVLQKKSAEDLFGMQTEVTTANGRQELIVTAVQGGLAQEWNRWAYLSKRFYDAVLPGMTIIRVSEVDGDCLAMQDALHRVSVELTLVRPEPEELLEFRQAKLERLELPGSAAQEPASGPPAGRRTVPQELSTHGEAPTLASP